MVGKINKSQVERTTNAGMKEQFPTQPVVAIVRNHLDSTYMGNLEVEILTSSNAGQSTNAPGQLLPVKYLSPFAGVTSLEGTSKNAGHTNSQRSYGFWAVPPDIGAKVLVIFAEGGDGYWIGCIPEDHTNIMTPDPWVSTTFNDKDKTKKLPVVEYNKKVETGKGRDSTQFIKPANQDVIDALTAQGLLEDEIRGTTTTSARREVPSAVLGLSSPGPQDKRPGAPRVNYGENFAQTPQPQNRLGGSSLVFDDGDATLIRQTSASEGPAVYVNVEGGDKGGDPTLPHNELVRLRTRTGHQILLHNTEDLIYIANAKGSTWIELTSNGKIDIYAQDSVSVHTENDLNLKADRDINLEAGRDIHLTAGNSIFGTAAANIELTCVDGIITASGSVNLDTPDTNTKNIDVTGNVVVSSGINTSSLSSGSVNGTSAGSAWSDSDSSGNNDNQKLGSHSAGSATAPSSATEANIPSRIPQHEPWAEHENLDPGAFTPEKTDSKETEPQTQGTKAETPDTFKKNTQRDVRAEPAASAEEETPEAPADDGVTQTTVDKPGAIPKGVADAAGAVNSAMSTASVGGLINAVVDAGKAITFGVGQAIVNTIDSIAGPGVLDNISKVGGSVISDLTSSASSLLKTRTSLAKGNLPINVPTSNNTGAFNNSADRAIVADVGSGKYKANQTVTMGDGTKLRVQEVDGKRSLVNFNVE
jgi:hypothetical protein